MSDINPSDKAPLTCTFTVRVRMHGVEGDLQIAGGTLKQIRDAVGQLRDIRGIELVSEPRAWTTLPDGTPLCPKHNVPMRKRTASYSVALFALLFVLLPVSII